MPKFKRQLVPGSYLTAADMLQALSQQRLAAAALHGSILLAAEPAVAWLLDSCCVGAPLPADMQLLGGGGSPCVALEAVVAAAGANRAPLELQSEHAANLQQIAARQQRRAGKVGRAAAASAAAAAAAAASTQADSLLQPAGGVAVDDAAAAAAAAPGAATAAPPSGLELVQLSFQEACFLCNVLHCCQVFLVRCGGGADEPASPQLPQPAAPLSSEQLWRWCCEHWPGGAAAFAPQVAAYHHFRAKGWLPQPGLLYGAHYVLYPLHPEYAHSQFMVAVVVEEEGGGGSDVGAHAGGVRVATDEADSGGGGTLSWLDVHIMQRLARQVLKQLLLLHVVVPRAASLTHPDCLRRLAVREVLVQRWQPSEHREQQQQLTSPQRSTGPGHRDPETSSPQPSSLPDSSARLAQQATIAIAESAPDSAGGSSAAAAAPAAAAALSGSSAGGSSATAAAQSSSSKAVQQQQSSSSSINMGWFDHLNPIRWGPQQARDDGGQQRRVVVVPLDDSTHSVRALEWAVANVYRPNSQLHLLSVVPRVAGPYPAEVLDADVPAASSASVKAWRSEQQAHESETEALLSFMQHHAVNIGVRQHDVKLAAVTAKGGASGVGASIADYVAAERADLVVLGSRGLHGWQRHLQNLLGLGSVSYYTMLRCPCSVVVVKGDDAGNSS